MWSLFKLDLCGNLKPSHICYGYIFPGVGVLANGFPVKGTTQRYASMQAGLISIRFRIEDFEWSLAPALKKISLPKIHSSFRVGEIFRKFCHGKFYDKLVSKSKP